MSNPRDPTRMRQGLNPLLTQSLGPYHSQINTPLSGVSSTTHLNSAHTPASSIQPYNPQEWIASPAATSEQTRQYPEQRSPLPPPPYSPPRSQRPQSGVFESSPAANTSAARNPPSNLHRPSPEPSTNTSFPPPPGTRTSSRERRFGFHSLRRNREHHDSSPPEPMGARYAASASARGPAAGFFPVTKPSKPEQDEYAHGITANEAATAQRRNGSGTSPSNPS
ncbi:hypothetical protein CkaCkLH20_06479 [Colletotrichum karsti]|uniref:Uncharacterized protein n=1 Tax=Colletotrichum karsti TaxID=1095194 RepID=A0A9P6I446_9PEZI|nr:uncharacterized protein CkaCkLH20_06479 [Colletotrichum karsti]KAF9876033.1 hypothetical protein CkaCkLH20_06479 [Colletotrichum karsti]